MGALLRLFGGWLIQSVLLKFISFTILYLIVSSFATYLMSKLTEFSPDSIFGGLYSLSSGTWYFLYITAFEQGLPMLLSASILAFSIRRLPVIG
ncbi:MAG: DUF2523 domain-containing protein [Gammaproteobacteria bacterium]|nr:MAG: DUF2523 domain-containing protein [Gammaproteobacteria bacterium]